MPSLDITKCYVSGLNRILRANLGSQRSEPSQNTAPVANDEHGVILPFSGSLRDTRTEGLVII